MRFFAELPLRTKLMLISGLSSMITLLAVSVVFVLRDSDHDRQDFHQRQLILAQAVAKNARAALAFTDTQNATEALSSLSAEPSVWAAFLLTPGGEVFAQYLDESASQQAVERETEALAAIHQTEMLVDTGHDLRIAVPVELSNERLGVLHVVASQAELQQKEQQNWITIGLMGLLASMLAAGVADFLLQRSVSTRILTLVTAADKVRHGGEWSLEAAGGGEGFGHDEVGQLGAAFAEMMVQLKRRNQAMQESEHRYRTLVEAAPLGIYEMDEKGHFLATNAAGLALLDQSDEAAVLGQNVWDFLKPAGAEAESIWQQVIQGELVQFDGEMLREESATPVSAYLVAMQDQQAGGDRVIGLLQDISERQQYEQRIRHSQKMQAVGQLTGGIAHDFNNILGVLIGNLELMREQHVDADPKTARRLDAMERASQRAATLTRQLLGFTRRRAAPSASVNVNHLIREMQNLIARSLTPNIEVEYALDEDLWATGIDHGDFEDALLNLLLNARDAIGGKGQVVVETHNAVLDAPMAQRIDPNLTPGEFVEVVVNDNGEGIAPEKLERIFEPFYTTKPTGKGTGLGLSMVFGFMERSGGKIKVYSELNAGTSVRLYLPRSSEEQGEMVQQGPNTQVLRGDGETLLVVDDERDLLELTAEQLREMGYHVLTAGNGRDALAQLAEHAEVDLLLSDVVMPEMTGYELAAEVQQRHPKVKLLLASGFTERAVKSSGDRPAYPLLSKPYSAAMLARKVREVLTST